MESDGHHERIWFKTSAEGGICTPRSVEKSPANPLFYNMAQKYNGNPEYDQYISIALSKIYINAQVRTSFT